MHSLEFCPFCGCDDVDLKTDKHKYGFMSYAQCQHCAARGGSFVEDTIKDSMDRAIDDWNQKVLRSLTISDKIKRIVTQLEYDLYMIWDKIKNRDWT